MPTLERRIEAGSDGAPAGSTGEARFTGNGRASALALYGGPRAVTTRYHERWRRIRILDLLHIARFAARGVNTASRPIGPILELEKQFKKLTGCSHALTVNSGTAALHSAYYAVGVRPGDEVIVPAYTFFATAAPILQCGGTPVFCEVDPSTLTADPDDVERRITERTRAICVVHVWGNPARLDRFAEIARRHQIALIEDCSHAHGAMFNGRPVGSWGDVGCFSLQGNKPVTGGEAGIAVTNDPVIFDHMLALGHFLRMGADQLTETYDIDYFSLGLKYRPHLFAACLAVESFKRLGELNALRKRNYDILSEELQGCTAVSPIPQYEQAHRAGFMRFTFRYDPEATGGVPREAFVHAVAAEGVPIGIDEYTTGSGSGELLHRLKIFRSLDYSRYGGFLGGGTNRYRDQPPPPLPITEDLAKRLVNLPPFTRVPERFVRDCGRALRKVGSLLGQIRDFRVGA